MSEHVKGHAAYVYPGGQLERPIDYDIFQTSYNEIIISITEANGAGQAYKIPVRVKDGFCIKVNKASIANDTGRAEDLIKFLQGDTGSNFIRGTIAKLIIDNPNRDRLKA